MAPAPDTAFPTLTAPQLARLNAFGTAHDVVDGEILFREGEATYDFIVVLDSCAPRPRSPHSTATATSTR